MGKSKIEPGNGVSKKGVLGDKSTLLTLAINYDDDEAQYYDFSRATLHVDPNTRAFSIVAQPESGGDEKDRLVIRCGALESGKTYKISENPEDAEVTFYLKGVMDNYPTNPEGTLEVVSVEEDQGKYWVHGTFEFSVKELVAPKRTISVSCAIFIVQSVS